MNPKNLHGEIEYIAKSNLYKFGADGDNRLMVALCLIISLSQQLDYGNYALCKVNKLSDDATKDIVNKECVQLLYIQQALLYYSACFDTILQIVYFGFHIAEDFDTKERYIELLKEVRFKRIQSRLNERPNDNNCKYILKMIKVYYCSGRSVITDIINSVKHRGGISVQTLNTYIPPIANSMSITYEMVNKQPRFNIPQNYTVVKAEWFYPYTDSIEKYTHALELANKRIKNFIDCILKFMNISPNTINQSNFKLPFYFDNNGAEQAK